MIGTLKVILYNLLSDFFLAVMVTVFLFFGFFLLLLLFSNTACIWSFRNTFERSQNIKTIK